MRHSDLRLSSCDLTLHTISLSHVSKFILFPILFSHHSPLFASPLREVLMPLGLGEPSYSLSLLPSSRIKDDKYNFYSFISQRNVFADFRAPYQN